LFWFAFFKSQHLVLEIISSSNKLYKHNDVNLICRADAYFVGRETETPTSSMTYLRQHRKSVASKAYKRQHSDNLKH